MVSGRHCRCHSGYVLRRPVGIAAKMVALVEADCQFLAAVGIVIIAAAVAVVYSSHTSIMGEMTPIAIAAAAVKGAFSNAISGEWERGWSIPSPTAIVGGMMPTAVADAVRGVVR
jgi:hypothetical protein